MRKVALIFVIFQIFLLKSTFACNGYNVTISDIKKCDGSANLVRFSDDFGVMLTKECYFIRTGCIYYKSYNTAQMEWSMSRDGVKLFTQPKDFCANSFNGNVCPAKADKICFRRDQRKSLKAFRRVLGTLEGKYLLEYSIDHDGEKTCGSMQIEVARQ